MSAFCHKCGDDLLPDDPPKYHRACLATEVFTSYTTRGGDYNHAVIEGESTAVCGVVVHNNKSDPFKLDSPWSCKRCVKVLSKRDRTAPVVVHGGSHSGGKMHMTEQQNKALLEKDPDYVTKLMTPANMPGKSTHVFTGAFEHESELPNIKLKCDKCGRPHWNVKQAREHTCGQPPQYKSTDIAEFVALGYRRTSRKFGIISRVDRPDWKEFLARKGMLIGPEREGNGADHYRACYSKDKITLEPPSLALEVPTSGHDPVGFIPKDQLEQKLADAYAAECAECGRMRTTLEVKSLRPLTPEWQTLVINGVGVIEFELGTELAGKVFRALRITPEP